MRSPLEDIRLKFQPKLPKILEKLSQLSPVDNGTKSQIAPEVGTYFSHLSRTPEKITFTSKKKNQHDAHKVGVVFSGGPAPGGHNVISGLYDALKKLNKESQLIGFLNGPKGILEGNFIKITEDLLANYRNQGGFDLIGTGRTKIETTDHFESAERVARKLDLDGLVIIGGDDSNTNAAFLAEYFLSKNCKTTVVGIPKTIDGDLKNEEIEISFGFDTASKVYSEFIGNVARDALSAKKHTYFIKLMGRSASHLTLECALSTHPNMTLIGEEIAAAKKTLLQITHDIADIIVARSEKGKDYGVILIPEGIIEFIPEFKQLIAELDSIKSDQMNADVVLTKLSKESAHCFKSLPHAIQEQLLGDRDAHGNVQVSKIETERLLINAVKQELKERAKAGVFKGTFTPQPLFCGYEGRCSMPSNFDAQYCYALGQTAALFIDNQLTGYICYVSGLSHPVEEWGIGGRNLATMMGIEMRKGKAKPVIKKAMVDLHSRMFEEFKENRKKWALTDDYRQPGPIQFTDNPQVTDALTYMLK